MKSRIGFPKKMKYLTFGDPERSRSVWTSSFARFFLLFLSFVFLLPQHRWTVFITLLVENIGQSSWFLQSHTGVNRVSGNIYWVHSVQGFRRYGTSNLKNILKISLCYFWQDLIYRDFSWQKHASCTNGSTEFDEPYLIRREIGRRRKQTFFGCILLRGLGVFQKKNDFSMWNNGISTLRTLCRTDIVEGIVDCLEYLFSNFIEWNRIKCKTLLNSKIERFGIITTWRESDMTWDYMVNGLAQNLHRSRSLTEILNAEYLTNGTR